jgi:hypothetical protein
MLLGMKIVSISSSKSTLFAVSSKKTLNQPVVLQYPGGLITIRPSFDEEEAVSGSRRRLSSELIVDRNSVCCTNHFTLPDSLSLREAALIEPLSCAVHPNAPLH